MNKISLLIIIMVLIGFTATEIYAETDTDDHSAAVFFYGESSFYQIDAIPSRNKTSLMKKEDFVSIADDFSASTFFYGDLIPDPIAEIKFKSWTGLQKNKKESTQSSERMSAQHFFY